MKNSNQFTTPLPEKSGTLNQSLQEPCTEIDETCDLNHFQVVRSEFLANLREPSFVFNAGKISVNSAALRALPNVSHIQILINSDARRLVVKPCMEQDLYSIPWYCDRHGKHTPRTITGKLFYMKVCDLMGWEPAFRYKILGKLINANDGNVLLFDLQAAATYCRERTEDGKNKTIRTPYYPAEWKSQFGIPYAEHKKALQVNLFDGYALFSIAPDGSEQIKKEGD